MPTACTLPLTFASLGASSITEAIASEASQGVSAYYFAYPLGIAGAICIGHLTGTLLKKVLSSKHPAQQNLRILTADDIGHRWTVRNSVGTPRCADSGGWIINPPSHWSKNGTRLWVDLAGIPIEEVEVVTHGDGHASTIRLIKRECDLPRSSVSGGLSTKLDR